MSILGCQLSQPVLVVQGSARGSALLPDRQGCMSASLTNRNLTLPAGAARPYWMDNSHPTEQNGSFVPPALTTIIEKTLLVMPASLLHIFHVLAAVAAAGFQGACPLLYGCYGVKIEQGSVQISGE